MPAPKIVLYFTPDVKEIGRIPISDIKFEESKKPDRGRYEITLDTPCFLNGRTESLKSFVKSTTNLTFKRYCFGEKTEHVFKTNDYFEIWDDSVLANEWCYFRGMVKQVSKNEQGMQKTITLTIENAGGWMLGDNSVYYLSQLIIIQGQSPSNFFKTIKSQYGWIDQGGNETAKGESLGLDRIKTPGELLETLVDKIGNERVNLLRKNFYDDHESIKPIEYFTGPEVAKNNVFIPNKLSEMEGSMLEILQKFEGRPFSEIFIVETPEKSKIIWRNSRWRDYQEKLCMGTFPGKVERLTTLYTDPNIKYFEDKIFNSEEGPIDEKQYSGILSETINRTNDDVVNAFFLFPAMIDARKNVPSLVAAQTAYDQENAKKILDLDSIIRHGYKPVTLELPFIPSYMDAEGFNNSTVAQRTQSLISSDLILGQYLNEYTVYAEAMYKNSQDSGNGAVAFQNNLQVNIVDDFRIVRSKSDDLRLDEPESFYINPLKITWYFESTAPRTVIEWDRGFEKVRGEVFTDQGFLYA
ncbi:hypothetical protein KAR91_29500 [Candidatus Pacearchaeota archaeon]|nr:hypothetical protein [Candidatus Pacearchaeota archaeon]